MIDLATEDPIPLSRIPARFPFLGRHGGDAGKRLHFSTVFRWATKGVKGPGGARVRLETAKLGGSLVTSLAALNRFAAALAPVVEGDVSSVEPSRTARPTKGGARAGEELVKKGY